MKKLIRKSDCYSIEKVNERIAFYTNKMESTKTLDIDLKLLTFWENYKHKNYNYAETKS
jgi:hypothetical protein